MMTRTRFLIPLAISIFASPPLFAVQLISEECHGTETVKIGNAEPKSLPYTLAFKANLAENTYCYAACQEGQTYPIADAKTSPMKLADMEKGSQERHLNFDRASGKLTDHQVFDAGLGTVTRNAIAICKPSKP